MDACMHLSIFIHIHIYICLYITKYQYIGWRKRWGRQKTAGEQHAKETAEHCCCGRAGIRQHGWSRTPHVPPKMHTWAQGKENWDSQNNTELQMMKTWWLCRVNYYTKSLGSREGGTNRDLGAPTGSRKKLSTYWPVHKCSLKRKWLLQGAQLLWFVFKSQFTNQLRQSQSIPLGKGKA